ncbi:hypothetical protein [Acinetobacter gerneri]|uniref:Uncharacterized protein n=2 Tax=Acinetobacter gerneri TaxID=202952 RepID=N8ZJ64_9GAMM|nr:hypothetical protein [Acinetobacter gerneri]ENV31783.1 hypothetical protein F960_04152 [Acinetobacter gerneri DSM 14967 = CIP 107464 = MTCC 9824]MDQ9010844.1 hypothetical protein [Acinetobacter gerneri]MDQ9014980.1 hypothetical protein [Acinetobacter gerneri]MDQ9026151.1 hypothetical protein [Acinetobacter gerneri]MDQ9053432.1 hypothetical protein [Acinetobacter gerneri]
MDLFIAYSLVMVFFYFGAVSIIITKLNFDEVLNKKVSWMLMLFYVVLIILITICFVDEFGLLITAIATVLFLILEFFINVTLIPDLKKKIRVLVLLLILQPVMFLSPLIFFAFYFLTHLNMGP